VRVRVDRYSGYCGRKRGKNNPSPLSQEGEQGATFTRMNDAVLGGKIRSIGEKVLAFAAEVEIFH